jgi:hypothetical protein
MENVEIILTLHVFSTCVGKKTMRSLVSKATESFVERRCRRLRL